MSPADWRALIEALLDGRLSAEAFERRFMEAWRVRRGSLHPAIETLYHAVAAFTAAQAGRTEYDADETDLRQAARAALNELREDTGAPTRT